MKLFKFIALGVLALSTLSINAQETCASTSRNPWEWPGHNNWFFATNQFSGNILNFKTGVFTPAGDATKKLQAYEGVSAASDDQGNLIFLTNGRQVLDKNINETYGGLLEGNEGGSTANRGSAAQGVMTVRHPLAPFDYYVFTTDDALSPTLGFNYAVIDETGNPKSGTTRLGGIRTTEGISATFHANGVDIWITVQESGSNNLHAYLLTCAGIDLVNSPVISPGAPNCTGNEERGGVAFNWDGTQFVSAHPASWPDKRITMFDFDKKTGVFTKVSESSPSAAFPYDVTFSPDNSHILFSNNVGDVYSADITTTNPATIEGSSTVVATGGSGHSAIEIGADGILYRSSLGGGNLTRLSGNLNGGAGLAATMNVVTGTSRGLPTIYIPPAEEPDIEEVGPFCTTDPAIDLHTYWVCSGLSAEDTLKSRNNYDGDGITDNVFGHFDPAVAGEGTHEIIFTYCDVNDTIYIEVNSCVDCAVNLQDVEPEFCAGNDLLLDTMVLLNNGVGVWTIDSIPSAPGVDAILTEGADTIFDATNPNTKAGTYKLMFTVTSGGEVCEDSIYVTVFELPVVDLGNDTAICFGDPAITFDAENVGSAYAWLPDGEITQTISKDVAGEYIVEVTDVNGCQDTDSVVLTINALPVVNLGNDTAICFGDPAVEFDAENVGATYAWLPDGETTQTISKDVAGEYIVEITDVNGCQDTDSVVLTVNALPVVDLGNDTAICFGDPAVEFDAENVGATYAWLPDGETSQTISKDVTGEYIVEITDSNGCQDTDSVVLTVHTLPVVDLGNDTAICLGDPAVEFDAENVGATYAWLPDGETSQTISKDVTGEYIVEITDANGCQDTDSVVLTVHALPVVDLGNDTAICFGDAAIEFDAENVGAAYAWLPNGETTQTISKDIAGEYIVEITDSNGCQDTDSVVLTVHALPVVDLGNDTAICFGDAAIEFDAGNIGATYAWLPDGEITQTISKDVAGEYIVEVTDVNGCQDTDSVVLAVNALPVVDLGNDTAICFGDAAIEFDAGNIGATYAWLPGAETTQTISKDVAGEYIIEITDGNGCKDTDSVVLSVNALPIVDLGNNQEICKMDPPVALNVAQAGISYLWSTGATTQGISVKDEGDYNVRITDLNGCIGNDTMSLIVHDMPIVNIADATICAGDPAVEFDAGVGFVTYVWESGELTQTISKDVAGEYIVSFEDAKGCAGSDTVELFVNALPNPDLGVDQTICADAGPVVFDAGTYASYIWGGGEITQTISTKIDAEYSVEVTDVNGCKGKDTVNLTVIDLPTPNVILDISMCPGMSSTLDASVYDNGNGAYTYLWHDGSTGTQFIANAATSVWVDITDSYGCVGRDEAEVSVLNNLTVEIVGAPKVEICEGENVDLIPNYKAVDGYLFTWDNGSTDETINVDQSGNYEVHVDNGAGCEGDATIEVVVNPLPIVAPSVAAICDGEDVVIGNDQGAQYTYEWNTGATTAQITVNQKGIYTQTVTHASQGCEASTTVDVTVNSNPIPDLGDDITVCEGVDVALSDKSGTSNVTYDWSTTETSASIQATTEDNYQLTITTLDGCTGTDDVNVVFMEIPTVDLGKDINLCEGETGTVDAGNDGLTISWNTGQTDPSFVVNESNTHIVTVSNGTCSATDTIDVNVVPLPTSEIDQTLGNQLYCFDDDDRGIDIVAGTNNAYSYLWGTGETTGAISVNSAGTYVVNISVGNCSVSDNITISEYCPSALEVPNTFTPDGDGVNDSFNAVGDNITDYHMYIFNRWGELIFESESMTNDWDGKYKSRDVQVDTYVYKIYYSVNHPDGNPRKKQKVGHVNVLR